MLESVYDAEDSIRTVINIKKPQLHEMFQCAVGAFIFKFSNSQIIYLAAANNLSFGTTFTLLPSFNVLLIAL